MPLPNIDVASRFARIALVGVVREFPNKPDHVLTSAADARTPRELHPVFYGCYDWHSAVHTHWLMARLRRTFPALPERMAIDLHFDRHFRSDFIETELAYAADPQRVAFERPYGWAWLFKLAEELHYAGDENARAWSTALRPLTAQFSTRLIDWLPKQQYPVRSGVHSNTAFMLAFAHDYARATGDARMEEAVSSASLRMFADDRLAAIAFEPSGHDFLSPALIEADLMRRVMNRGDFVRWFDGWLPDPARSRLLTPVEATDRRDPHGGHLDGLNLSRAWCLRGLAAGGAMDAGQLSTAAAAHLAAALPHVESGDFLGEHWLATFALHAMTCADDNPAPG
jgi:Protein of unknown function (DUF2891)